MQDEITSFFCNLLILLGKYSFYGVRGGIRTHGPRIHTTSTFAAAVFPLRSWSGLSLHHGPLRIDRRCPSSLYTFPEGPGLARDRHSQQGQAFPDFEQIHHAVSHHGAQLI